MPVQKRHLIAELLSMQGYTVRYLYKGGHADAKVYLADQVNDREAQGTAVIQAQRAKIEKQDARIADLEQILREVIPYIYIPGSAQRELELSEKATNVLMERST
jgi:hypothetical protein